MPFNPESQLQREMIGLAQVYEGRSRYWEKTLDTMVKRTHNSFVTEFLLPLVYTEDQHHAWTKWHFDRTLAPQTAAQAPPEYVQFRKEKDSKSLQRHALAATIGAEELKTEEGQFIFAGQLTNMVMSVVESIEQQGINEFLIKKNHYRYMERQKGPLMASVSDLFEAEKQRWDIIRKEPSGRGAYILDEQVKKTMRDVIATDMVVPEGTRSLITMAAPELEYYRAGPDARENLRRGAEAITVFREKRIHIVREFDLNFDGTRIAPLKRERVIGDHFRMDDYYMECDDAEYCSKTRNVDVFDVSADDFRPVELRQALRHCERFEDDERGSLKQFHYRLCDQAASMISKYNLSIDEGDIIDMFIYRQGNTCHVTEYIGDQEMAALSYEQARSVGRSIAARARAIMTADEVAAISNGIQWIEEKYAANDGQGSAAGLIGIAETTATNNNNNDERTMSIAKAFAAAVKKLHALMTSIFVTDHPALDPRQVPSAFKETTDERNSLINFAQNIVDYNKPVLADNPTDNAAINVPEGREFVVTDSIAQEIGTYSVDEGVINLFTDPNLFKDTLVGSKAYDGKTFEQFLSEKVATLPSTGNKVNVLNAVSRINAGQGSSSRKRIIEEIDAAAKAPPAKPAQRGGSSKRVVNPQAINAANNTQILSPYGIGVVTIGEAKQQQEAVAQNPASYYYFAPSGARAQKNNGYATNTRSGVNDSGLGAQPSFYGKAMVDVVDGEFQVNRNMAIRYSRANREERDPLVRIGTQMLLLAPVCRATYERLIDADVRCPVAVLGERPFRRYETGSILYVRGGERLGFTAYSHNDVHISVNAVNKTLSVHYSFYFAPIIKNTSEYFIAEDVVVTGYKGGDDLVPFTARTFSAKKSVARQPGSVFFFLVPYGSLRGPNAVPETHDIRGRFDEDVWQNRLQERAMHNVNKPHYPSALYYNAVYHFDNLITVSQDEQDYFRHEGRHDNTVTHQTMQWMYNPTTKTKDKILNTGHFGIHIYRGHRKIRQGLSSTYAETNYLQDYKPIF